MNTFNLPSENYDREGISDKEETISIPAVYYSRSDSDLEPVSLICIRPGFMNERVVWYDTIHDRIFEISRRNFHEGNPPPKIELTTKKGTHIRLKLLDLKTYNDFIKMNTVGRLNFNSTEEVQKFYLNKFSGEF
jgi:hypothetical protein